MAVAVTESVPIQRGKNRLCGPALQRYAWPWVYGREWRIGSSAIPYIFLFPALSNYVQHIVVDEKLSYIYVFSAANIAYVGIANNPAERYAQHLAGRGGRR